MLAQSAQVLELSAHLVVFEPLGLWAVRPTNPRRRRELFLLAVGLSNLKLGSFLLEMERLHEPFPQATPPAEASLTLSRVREIQPPGSASLWLAVECLVWWFLLGA